MFWTTVFVIALIMFAVQLVTGVWGLVYNSLNFKDWNRNLATSRENEIKKANNEYYDSYRDYNVLYCTEKKQEYATYARQFGLLAVAAPASIILVPCAILGAAGYGVKQGVNYALPALTYKGD